jgi:Protein of unknown function (DUF3375)
MKRTPRGVAAWRGLRAKPLWTLLSADKAPLFMALMQELLLEGDKVAGASVLTERLGQALEELRAEGEDLPQSAQGYLSDWLAQGWLTRRLPPGASEELYELSSDAAQAIRFMWGSRERRSLATESRLATVMRALLRLNEETDPNPASRITALLHEQERIERELELVKTHGVTPLGEERALERVREVLDLAQALAHDFRRVRDDFEGLNRGFRQSLMEHEGSRGDVLEAVFAGVDLIGDSEAGRSFGAFWALLTDPEQAESLREAIEALSRRPFLRRLATVERKFLLGLTARLVDEGGSVHDVLQSFARSLKSFVQSKEFQEQRRMHTLLKRATQAALATSKRVLPGQDLGWELMLTSARIQSASQHVLHDPSQRVVDASMREAEPAELGLDVVGELVRQSEIDFRSLRRNLRAVLTRRRRASIGEVLALFPAEQGFGSVVGYVALGVKHGELSPGAELVHWRGHDHAERGARVPTIYFTRERGHELVD